MPPAGLPLLAAGDVQRVLAWRHGRAVGAGEFLAHVRQVAAALPERPAVVNLCVDRYAFMVAFCAAMLRDQVTLLPPSRAPGAVADVLALHAGAYALGDLAADPTSPAGYRMLPPLAAAAAARRDAALPCPRVPAEQMVAIAYTSGSTGQPQAAGKTWASFHASTAGNLAMLRTAVDGAPNIVATVPAQHMYGVETSILLPLLGGYGVYAGRPFFPADVARALAQVPAPRMLVTTPVHLGALVDSGLDLPPLALMLSATAPLSVALARQAEQRFAAPLREVFGSTETCVFASRRTGADEAWRLYPGAVLEPCADGTLVCAPQLASAAKLADIVALSADALHFTLQGRNADLLEIAGKRASLGDLTRRLLAIPGVRDGVVFQMDERDALGVRRIVALVVAPGIAGSAIVDGLRQAVDPVFLPRPLRVVDALPRNDTGKLPRAALLAALRGGTAG